jgi:hypothetical protein
MVKPKWGGRRGQTDDLKPEEGPRHLIQYRVPADPNPVPHESDRDFGRDASN